MLILALDPKADCLGKILGGGNSQELQSNLHGNLAQGLSLMSIVSEGHYISLYF